MTKHSDCLDCLNSAHSHVGEWDKPKSAMSNWSDGEKKANITL